MQLKHWVGVVALAVVVGALTAALVVSVVQTGSSSVGLGLMIETIAAAATVGALLAALGSLQRQVERDRIAEAERRLVAERAQAEQVSAWCLGTEDPDADGLVVRVVCRNGSAAPVYDLALTVYPMPDWANATTWTTRDDLGALGPAKEEGLAVRIPPPVGFNLGSHTPVAIKFRDAGGRYWLRQPDGVLVRMD